MKAKTVIVKRCCVASLLFVCSGVAASPIATSDRSSFARLNGLPVPVSGRVLDAGVSSLSLNTELTSQFAFDESESEFVLIDSEITEFHLRGRWGVGSGVDITLDVPWLHQSGGVLDGFVQDWHDTFSLPNGGRDRFEQNRVRYDVQVGNETFEYRQGSQGFGDIAVGVRSQLHVSTARALAWYTHLELPTGDVTQMTGSDSVDVAVGLDYDDQSVLSRWDIELHSSLGWLWFGDSHLLGQIKRDHTWFASASVSKAVWQVPLQFQLQGHGVMYDAAMAPFARPALQAVFASEFSPSQGLHVQLGMSEDIITKSSPDFTFFMHLTKHYEN